jgi:hypothetical protein
LLRVFIYPDQPTKMEASNSDSDDDDDDTRIDWIDAWQRLRQQKQDVFRFHQHVATPFVAFMAAKTPIRSDVEYDDERFVIRFVSSVFQWFRRDPTSGIHPRMLPMNPHAWDLRRRFIDKCIFIATTRAWFDMLSTVYEPLLTADQDRVAWVAPEEMTLTSVVDAWLYDCMSDDCASKGMSKKQSDQWIQQAVVDHRCVPTRVQDRLAIRLGQWLRTLFACRVPLSSAFGNLRNQPMSFFCPLIINRLACDTYPKQEDDSSDDDKDDDKTCRPSTEWIDLSLLIYCRLFMVGGGGVADRKNCETTRRFFHDDEQDHAYQLLVKHTERRVSSTSSLIILPFIKWCKSIQIARDARNQMIRIINLLTDMDDAYDDDDEDNCSMSTDQADALITAVQLVRTTQARRMAAEHHLLTCAEWTCFELFES